MPTSRRGSSGAQARAGQVISVPDEVAVYRDRLAGKLVRRRRRYKVIDLFAGAGGMTLGFTKKFGHDFVPVWANDFNEAAARTYNLNFGDHCTHGDIVSILEGGEIEIPRADVVLGGPPCQGFSLLNKNRDGDPRKQLWRPYMDIVERSGARVFVIENVPQLLGSEELRQITARAKKLGFQIAYQKLCAADYGVPQTRWRAVVIGCKFADPADVFPPARTHFDPSARAKRSTQAQLLKLQGDLLPDANPWRTVRDAVSDLPSPVGTEVGGDYGTMSLHFGRTPNATSMARYRAIPREGMNRFDLQRLAPHLTPECWIRKTSGGTDLFGRLWYDRPAFTIRTEFFKPEKGRYLHPEQHRPITHREAARFQSFPDDFKFTGTKIEIAKQIGNAVPPVLAARIADCVYALLEADRGDD